MKARKVLAIMPDGTEKPFLELMDDIDREYEEFRKKSRRVYKYSMMGGSNV